MKKFRDNGAIGALLDEYEKVIQELQSTIEAITPKQLTTIVDKSTKDEDCRSIQTILTHVVRAGYGYATYIRKDLGETLEFRERITLDSVAAYQAALAKMFAYNEQLFVDYPNLKLQEHEASKKMLTNWGQRFDAEQILEHAIVHVLRHRRQIERFLIRLNEEI